MQKMDLFKTFMINFREIKELYQKCIGDIPYFFLIIYSKNLIKNHVLQ